MKDQKAALRVLLDSFYGACGYVPWYDRPEYNTADSIYSSELYLLYLGKAKAKEQRAHWTDEEKRMYIKYNAVMSLIGRLGNITKTDARFPPCLASYHECSSRCYSNRKTRKIVSFRKPMLRYCKSLYLFDGIQIVR